MNGPNKLRENTCEYIDEAIEKGYDVEIDVWVQDDGIWLGHDKSETKIDVTFLNKRVSNIWCHAKNLAALVFLLSGKFNTFSHDNDEYILTSRGYIWAHPNSKFTSETIAVMPEWNSYTLKDLEHCKGVCSDFISSFV